MIELDEALAELELIDARKANLVKLRFFLGLTNEEIASVLDIDAATVVPDRANSRP